MIRFWFILFLITTLSPTAGSAPHFVSINTGGSTKSFDTPIGGSPISQNTGFSGGIERGLSPDSTSPSVIPAQSADVSYRLPTGEQIIGTKPVSENSYSPVDGRPVTGFDFQTRAEFEIDSSKYNFKPVAPYTLGSSPGYMGPLSFNGYTLNRSAVTGQERHPQMYWFAADQVAKMSANLGEKFSGPDSETEAVGDEPCEYCEEKRKREVVSGMREVLSSVGRLPAGETRTDTFQGHQRHLVRIDNCKAQKESLIDFQYVQDVGVVNSDCSYSNLTMNVEMKEFIDQNLEACTYESIQKLDGHGNRNKKIAKITVIGQGSSNQRKIKGTNLWSLHSMGLSIDINSLKVVFEDGRSETYPASASDITKPNGPLFPGFRRTGTGWDRQGTALFEEEFTKCLKLKQQQLAASKIAAGASKCSGGIMTCDDGTAHWNHAHFTLPFCAPPDIDMFGKK